MPEETEQQGQDSDQETVDTTDRDEVLALLVRREKDAVKAEANVVECTKALKEAKDEQQKIVKNIRGIIREVYDPTLFNEGETENEGGNEGEVDAEGD